MLIKTKNGVFKLEKIQNATMFDSFVEKAKTRHRELAAEMKKAKTIDDVYRLSDSLERDFKAISQEMEKMMRKLDSDYTEASRKIASESNVAEKELMAESKKFK